MFCTNCGTQNEDGVKFCINCGNNLEEDAQQAVAPAEELGIQEVNNELGFVDTAEQQAQQNGFLAKFKNPKNIIMAAAAVIVAVILIVVCVNLFGSDEIDYSEYPIVYNSDGKVRVRPNGEDESYKLGSEVGDVKFSVGAEYIYFTEDDKLYYRDANDLEARDEKLASDVSYFTVLGDTTDVAYRTTDGDLYFHDLKEKYKLAKDVTTYIFDEDLKKLVYLTDEGKLCIRGIGADDESEKIATKVTSMIYADPSLDNIYYRKDDVIYLYDGKEATKIGKDFAYADYIGETLYATKEITKKYTFDELVNDDFTDMLEPYLHLRTRPTYSDFDSYSDYRDAYDQWYDAYYELDEEIRDGFYVYDQLSNIKESFDEDPIEISTYDLYVYKDGEFEKMDSGLTNSEVSTIYAEEPENYLMYYYKSEGGKVSKVNLSDYADNIYSLRSSLTQDIYGSSSDRERVICKNGKILEGIDSDVSISDFELSFDGKYLYALVKDDSDDEEGNVTRYKVGSDKLTGAEVILKDVTYFNVYGENDDILAETEDNEVVGIIDGDEVNLGEDIYTYRYFDGEVYYIVDYNEEKNSGELIRYNGGDKITICDDVYDQIAIFGENKIVYIQDYTPGEGGELCVSDKKGNAEVIDDEVRGFMTYYN